MFLERYKLESNPFAPRQVRPRLNSVACRAVTAELHRVLGGSLYCLFVSGRPGAGKSTLVERHLKDRAGVTVSLIGAGIASAQQFLTKVLSDIGLPAIDASVPELRNILEVYLRHQAGKGVRIVLVADPLERLAEPVLAELEALMGIRYKNRPIMGFVLLTRSEELVQQLTPSTGMTLLAPYAHARLAGFTLEETAEYISACVHSVGGQDPLGLFPGDVCRDIHAYTQGIVADVTSLCFEALNLLANEGPDADHAGLELGMIARASEKLNLRYEPAFWRNIEDALSPASIQQTDPGELKLHSAQLVVSSRGEVIAEISLSRPRMVLGRDQSCDISLDSSYVSRYQNLFMETSAGWLLIDLSSTNGCFVNGRRVSQHELQDGDIIAVGHHQISFVGPQGRKSAVRTDVPATVERSRAGDTLVSPIAIGKVESG